ncbi:MAG: serine hydrolase domain-containing protein [Betaproteobacteria bacterium]|nr:serine hydrolase domain-containing protein [Betaproteobacteria bacterium]
MSVLNDILAAGVASGAAPGFVAMTGNAAGVKWSGTAGERAPGQSMSEDTVFRIFSMTKAIGSTAAMILIDRGKLDPGAPVDSILPDFAKIQVLEGFDGDTPRLRAPKSRATIRQLATHTSGLVYEFWNPDVPRWMAKTGHPTILSGLKASLFYPMVFDPGTRWDYGIGIDWLCQAVEAIDGRRIDKFCQEEIFAPLGMRSTAFECEGALAERLASVSARGEDGKFAPFALAPPPHPEFYGMGHALYSTAGDYMRFLRMFLNKGALDGKRVLGEKGVATMLANHIGDLRVGKMTTVVPPVTADVDLFPGIQKTHSLGFLRVESDVPGMRSAGSQGWAGVLNTHFWFDPAKDVAGTIMTQTLPFVEPRFLAVYEQFERAVYAARR